MASSKHCIIESIKRSDFFKLCKKYYQLADKLEIIRLKFAEDETDFDFFRFRKPRVFTEQIKSQIRLKFRVALTKFIKAYKKGQKDIPEALKILKEF